MSPIWKKSGAKHEQNESTAPKRAFFIWMITGLKLVYFFFLVGRVKCLVLHLDTISADFLLNLV